MKITTYLSNKLLALASVLAIGALAGLHPTQAQVSGGIIGIESEKPPTSESGGFQMRTKSLGGETVLVTISAEFQKGAPEAHAFAWDNGLLNSITPIGPGPGSVLVDEGTKRHFDGGDGPDYVVPVGPGPGDFLVGSDAADSFDGGDGPDYITPIGPGPGDFLVGSDAADSFDGGDGPDYITPTGPGPSHAFPGRNPTDTRFEIQFVANRSDMHQILQMTTSLYALVAMAYESMAISVPANGLKGDANEVAVFEDYGVSLSTSGNEVAIVSSLDQRSVEQRWFEWNLLHPSVEGMTMSGLALEFDRLLLEHEVGMLDGGELDLAIKHEIENTLLLFGLPVQ